MIFKKIAFFVEGYTEQEFLTKLLTEIFNSKEIAVEIKKLKGGSSIPISCTRITTPIINEETKYYILIYNCGGETNVKSYILDQRMSLCKNGYKKIIGLQDVYPRFTREEIDRLQRFLLYGVPQRDIPISFLLSIMEIEGWFIAEENHYKSISTSLTPTMIRENFGFDPSNYNTELIDQPANLLNNIYQTVGETYQKDNLSIDRTINSLDFANMYMSVNNRIQSFRTLTDEIEACLLM